LLQKRPALVSVFFESYFGVLECALAAQFMISTLDIKRICAKKYAMKGCIFRFFHHWTPIVLVNLV
jgi:hypothetical protein